MVSKEAWNQLIALLNNPAESTPALKHLLDDAFDFRQR